MVAKNDSGTDSDPSPPATEIPATVPDMPAAPTVGDAAKSGAAGQVGVSWTAVNGNGDDDVTYTVNWSNDQGDKGVIEVAPGKPTSVTISPITLGANYTAMVTAQNKAGSSGRGEPGRVSPYTAPDAVGRPRGHRDRFERPGHPDLVGTQGQRPADHRRTSGTTVTASGSPSVRLRPL